MRTFAILNMKGGVSKTTTAINLAYLLATEYQRRVLLIDADPQANATHALLPDGERSGLAGLLGGYATVYDKVIVASGIPNLDVIPASEELWGMLIPRGQVGKSIRYLLHQCQGLAAEVDEEGADPIPDAQLLTDYWTMVEALGRDLADPSVKYPANLIAAHDRASDLMRQKELDDMAELFRIRRRVLKKYAFISNGLLIRPAASQRELTAEGDTLHHCVGSYGESHATGKTAIFLIRRVARPKEPYFTLELDEKKLNVRQNHGSRNCARTPEVEAFEKEWLAWVRAGAPREKNGKPLQTERTARKAKQGTEAA